MNPMGSGFSHKPKTPLPPSPAQKNNLPQGLGAPGVFEVLGADPQSLKRSSSVKLYVEPGTWIRPRRTKPPKTPNPISPKQGSEGEGRGGLSCIAVSISSPRSLHDLFLCIFSIFLQFAVQCQKGPPQFGIRAHIESQNLKLIPSQPQPQVPPLHGLSR